MFFTRYHEIMLRSPLSNCQALIGFCILSLSFIASASDSGKREALHGFVENVGQVRDDHGTIRADVLATMQLGNVRLFVRRTGLSYVFSEDVHEHRVDEESHRDCERRLQAPNRRSYRMDVEFIDSFSRMEFIGKDEAVHVVRFATPSGLRQAQVWESILLRNIYPNIDMVMRVTDSGLKYDIVVHPGGDVRAVRLNYLGASSIIRSDGSMSVQTPLGAITERRPVTYAVDSDGKRTSISSAYNIDGSLLTFAVGDHSNERALVIDPFVEWATYLGGTGDEYGNGVSFDGTGNVIVAGWTRSMDFPSSPGVIQENYGGLTDVFVSKFSPTGQRLWTTYLGGPANDAALAVAANDQDMIAVTGFTESDFFFVTPGAMQEKRNGSSDGFVTVLHPDGTVNWSTYFGGSLVDEGHGVTFDASGSVVLTGRTTSVDFPISFGAFQQIKSGGLDAFVMKFRSDGVRLWGTFFGGVDEDWGHAVAVDPSGNVVISGHTLSGNFPVTSDAWQPVYRGLRDGFVAKFSPTGVRVYATFIGGGTWDDAYGVTVDDEGNMIATGGTESFDYPASPGAFQTERFGNVAAFVFKMDASGQRLWSTYYGGARKDIGNSIDAYPSGNVMITGHSNSTDLVMTPDAAQTASAGLTDAFAVKFRADGSLKYATYIGGSDEDSPESNLGLTSIATHPLGWAAISGWTKSTDFPTTPGSFQPGKSGNWDAYLLKFGCTLDPLPVVTAQGPTTFCDGDSVRLLSPAGYAWYRWSTDERTQSIVVRQSGSYRVMVADTNDCGGLSQPIGVTVNPLPQPVISASGPTTLCDGDSVVLDAGASYATYSWSNGANSRTITVKTSGSYFVSVRDTNGCSNSSPAVDVVVNPRPTVTITAKGPTRFCMLDSVVLDAGMGFSSYRWSTGETSQNITVRASGSFTVSVTNAFGCVATSAPIEVTVHPLPNPTITASGPLTFCDGDSVVLDGGAGFVSWQWSNGATSRFVTIRTTQLLSVTVIDSNTCTATSPSVQVTVNPRPVAAITVRGATSFCAGDSVILDAGPGFASYNWSNGATTQTVVVRSSITLNVTVAFATGCASTSPDVTITVHPDLTPTITPAGPVAFCDGDSVILRAPSGFISYLWSNGAQTQNITVKSGGDYSVAVRDSNGCTWSSAISRVTVHPLPAIPTITQVRDTLLSSPEFGYQWLLNGVPLPNETNRQLLIPRSGIYTVTVTTADGCSATSPPLSVFIAQTVVSIPVLEAAPGEVVRIPLRIESSENLIVSGAKDFRAVIRINRDILQPLGNVGVWSDNGTDRTITLQGQWSDTLGTLTQFECQAMLGAIDRTPLTIDFFEWTTGAVRVTRVHGEFRLKICRDGGDRLFDWTRFVALKQNRPNPFNAQTIIEYDVIEEGPTRLEVFDALGRRVAVLLDGSIIPGSYTASFDGSALPSGMYIIILTTPTQSFSRTMQVLK